MPPETLQAWKNFINVLYKPTKKVDIYALGIILWEIATSKQPYQTAKWKNKDNSFNYDKVIQEEREEIPKEIWEKHPVMAKLIEECWNQDPEKRPTCENIAKRL